MSPCWYSHTNAPTAFSPLTVYLCKWDKSFFCGELASGKRGPGRDGVQGRRRRRSGWWGFEWRYRSWKRGVTPPCPLRVWWRSRCSCSPHCQPHQGGRQPTGWSSAEEGLDEWLVSSSRQKRADVSETKRDQLTSSALNLSHWVVRSSSRLQGETWMIINPCITLSQG